MNKVYLEYQQINNMHVCIAGGRRGNVTLGHILRFTTGADEEPVLGFKMHPALEFCEGGPFFPTSNTCINTLKLMRGSLSSALPSELYDLAFCNAYFGVY